MDAVKRGWEALADLLPASFVEHVAIFTIAEVITAGIIGLLGFLASRRIWRSLRCQWRAATICKAASDAFTIIRCPIAHDPSGSIGNEISIRLETAFRAFAGWDATGERPFQVMEFPLELPSDESTKSYDQAVETAKRWLERTNGDILIWGKHVKGGSVGFIRLIGKDRKNGTIEARRIDFDKQAEHFDEALSIAIAYEVAKLTQATLSEPEIAALDLLRTVSVKMRKLARADAPAPSGDWRARIAAEYRRLLQEIARRTPDVEDQLKLEEVARAELAKLEKMHDPCRYAETALRIATLVRKRNWFDPNAAELADASSLVEEAIPLLESVGEVEHAAESALESVLTRRLELVFFGEEAESDALYKRLFGQATR